MSRVRHVCPTSQPYSDFLDRVLKYKISPKSNDNRDDTGGRTDRHDEAVAFGDFNTKVPRRSLVNGVLVNETLNSQEKSTSEDKLLVPVAARERESDADWS